jgi:predicted nucleic acid-binding protein
MKVVVADTSPINYLVLIGKIGILHDLWVRILIPKEVFSELTDSGSPPAVRQWARTHPEWLEVRDVAELDTSLLALDPGEASAIALAQAEPDVLLLIDDAAGRREAARRKIPNTGTLGILRAASERNLLDLPSVLDRLLATNFRVSSQIVAALIEEDSRKRHAR